MPLSPAEIRRLNVPKRWGAQCYRHVLAEPPRQYPQLRQKPCSDCAVTCGLCSEIATGCYQQLDEDQRQVVAEHWDCHNGGRCEGAWLVLVGGEDHAG